MKTNEVAKLTGITVRTLQYYDKIGLLQPKKNQWNQYREYTKEDVEILQQILFFRELDFSLAEIKELMANPNYDKKEALARQKHLLTLKRDRLNRIIALVTETMNGGDSMKFEAFDDREINEYKDQYAKEVRERWGDTSSYAEYAEKSKNYGKENWAEINGKTNEILKGFSELRTLSPDHPDVQAQVKLWQDHITKSYYTCTDEILYGLSLMYVNDERFQKNIDKNGEGTAAFLAKAIQVYCKKA